MLKLATFHTQTGAIRFDKKLKVLGYDSILKPVPRKLSSSCGICVEFFSEAIHFDLIEDLENIYTPNNMGYDLIYTTEDEQ